MEKCSITRETWRVFLHLMHEPRLNKNQHGIGGNWCWIPQRFPLRMFRKSDCFFFLIYLDRKFSPPPFFKSPLEEVPQNHYSCSFSGIIHSTGYWDAGELRWCLRRPWEFTVQSTVWWRKLVADREVMQTKIFFPPVGGPGPETSITGTALQFRHWLRAHAQLNWAMLKISRQTGFLYSKHKVSTRYVAL